MNMHLRQSEIALKTPNNQDSIRLEVNATSQKADDIVSQAYQFDIDSPAPRVDMSSLEINSATRPRMHRNSLNRSPHISTERPPQMPDYNPKPIQVNKMTMY